MLEHARPGERALLGHVADQQHRDPQRLGHPHDLAGDLADLADRAGRARQLGRVERLDRVDHAHLGPLLLERRQHGLRDRSRRSPGCRARRRLAAARLAAGSAPPTPRPRRTACGGPAAMRLASTIVVSVDLPIPGAPPISTSEPGTIPPPSTLSSSPIPVVSRSRSAAATSRERDRLTARAAAGLEPRPRAAGAGPAHLLDQRVPLAAAGALSRPPRALVAAGRADVDRSRSRHQGSGGYAAGPTERTHAPGVDRPIRYAARPADRAYAPRSRVEDVRLQTACNRRWRHTAPQIGWREAATRSRERRPTRLGPLTPPVRRRRSRRPRRRPRPESAGARARSRSA